MQSNSILTQVLRMCNTEQQGKAYSGLFETFREFVNRWFGEDVNIIVGGFYNDAEYFYSYNEPLQGIADIILEADNERIYLYVIE